jgi:hypothetical protein
MHSLLQIVTIILALAGAYLLAFGLKVKKQYSDDVVKDLELKKKGLLIITEVTQREALIAWGLGLLTLASILQIICIYLY